MMKPTKKQRRIVYKKALEILMEDKDTFLCHAIEEVLGYNNRWRRNWDWFPELYNMRDKDSKPKYGTAWWVWIRPTAPNFYNYRKLALEWAIAQTY